MIVVDSSVWIANLRNADRPAVAYLNDTPPSAIIVGDLVLMEVLRGARDDRHAAEIETRLRRFRIDAMLNAELAIRAAGHYRSLRSCGVTISKMADLLIATFCIAKDQVLLHDDRDFVPFEKLGLRVAQS